MNIIYCIDDKLGGVSSLNYNLIANCENKETKQTVLQIHCDNWDMAKSGIVYPVQETIYFNYNCLQNYYKTLQQLRKLIPEEAGAIVVNYDTEMSMLDHYPVKQTVYQLVHDDYNLGLAKKYGHVVDVFICHNSAIYEQLNNYFINRQQDIHFLQHGVPVSDRYRNQNDTNSPLKLLFLGRMAREKGLFDLPLISTYLQEKHIEVEWVCIGSGPELENLKRRWNQGENVKFYQPETNEAVMEIAAGMDLFVLPTKFEGTPVSLLETMSVGLVPVVSDLPGGIRDIITEEIGFRIPVDDNRGFARAITKLYHDRDLLDRLSNNCRNIIVEQYDIKKTALAYHSLFAKYSENYRPKKLQSIKVGARLDQQFIPSFATKFIRKYFKKA